MKIGVILLLIVNLSFVYSEIIISEVELNPSDSCNDCTEWLELYSNQQINLNGWHLKDASNKTHSLNFSFVNYYVISNLNISLNNNNEQIFLYNGSTLIFSTPILSDSSNDNKSWQYCRGDWKFKTSTPNQENDCLEEQIENNTSIYPNLDNEPNLENKGIELKINWDNGEIINGKDFEIEIKAYNLKKEKYDLKVWIENSGNIISEVFNEDKDKWQSGNYYLDDFFTSSGDKKEKIKLRIREEYSDYYEKAKINARLRKGSSLVSEEKESINILKAPSNNSSIKLQESVTSQVTLTEPSETITLNNKKDNSIIYKSKNEYIREYTGYAFGIFCILLIILFILQKKNGKREKS